jgi:hypothetical protein
MVYSRSLSGSSKARPGSNFGYFLSLSRMLSDDSFELASKTRRHGRGLGFFSPAERKHVSHRQAARLISKLLDIDEKAQKLRKERNQ